MILSFNYPYPNSRYISWEGIHLQFFIWHTSYNIRFCNFQSPNSRSKPFNMISILKYAWRSDFTFFWIFLLFIKYFTKLLFFSGPELSRNSSFVKYLINSKQIQKNVKFDLQAHFNIKIMLNGLDRLFGLWKSQNRKVAKVCQNFLL